MADILRTTASIGTYDEYTRTVPILASTPNSPDGKQPAISTWDLTRYIKNPAILWAHDQGGMRLPIGRASDIEVGPFGLRMKATLASAQANPLAEEIWNCIREKVITAVSVGYEITGPNSARLIEVSFVPIGLDEDAGTADINPAAISEKTDASLEEATKAVDALAAFMKTLPKRDDIPPGDVNESDEDVRKRISTAASLMSKHRARLAKKLRDEREAAEK
jgi:HK97 family phage prohead protease